MKGKLTLIRYYREGWYHAELIRQGRKWAVVRDLHRSRRADGTYTRRCRKVSLAEIREALWQ